MQYRIARIGWLAALVVTTAVSEGCATAPGHDVRDFREELRSVPQDCRVVTVAHRGGRSLAPENTLAAARKAREVGAEMWEVDVRLSADGEPILLHDETLERTSNVAEVFPDRRDQPVSSFTRAELRRLDAGSWFLEEDREAAIQARYLTRAELRSYVGEPIPTLLEALRLSSGVGLDMDIELKGQEGKADETELVERVVRSVEATDMVGHVIITSFNHDYLRQVKRLNPAIRVGALTKWPIHRVADYLQDLGAEVYVPKYTAVRPRGIRALHDRGIEVFVYTVNDPERMVRFIRAGVSGLITDYPHVLRKIVDQCFQERGNYYTTDVAGR